MTHVFRMLLSHAELQAVRDIADSVWPPTFREILSPEQIVYMMKMMYAASLDEALAMAREIVGEEAKVTVIPNGISVIVAE